MVESPPAPRRVPKPSLVEDDICVPLDSDGGFRFVGEREGVPVPCSAIELGE
jgi:hypothetical protein